MLNVQPIRKWAAFAILVISSVGSAADQASADNAKDEGKGACTMALWGIPADQIIATVLGGFLAAGTGWLLQNRQEATRLKRLKRLLIVGVSDDLIASAELYDRIADEWRKSEVIWFTTINELRQSRQTYTNNRDWMVLIKDEHARLQLFKYYQRSAELLNLLENHQRRKYEVVAKANEIIRDLQMREPLLSREDASVRAVALMEAETQELDRINKLLPQNVQRCQEFKSQAKDLLNILSQRKDA